MDFYLSDISAEPYKITVPEKIPTPRLLVFRERLERNIGTMKQLLQSAWPGFPMSSLWPHVKTHKSAWVTQKLKNAGVQTFKATPQEVDMLLQAGVKKIFIAYPLLAHEAQRLARLAGENPGTKFFVQVSHRRHAEYLLSAARQYGVSWHFFIDLDVGMHRTGIQPQDAVSFYNSLPQTDCLQFAGLHAYDGHNHATSKRERKAEAKRCMGLLVDAVRQLEKITFSIPRVVVGGTPSFTADLEYLSKVNLEAEVVASPGTWVYFDTTSRRMMPGTFEYAACILTQVMDRIDKQTVTLNIGHKRWAVDQGPVESFSIAGMKALRWSEEHTVVSVPAGKKLDVGDYVLVAPRHVCSTVNLWEFVTVIGPDGRREISELPVDARNR